MPRAALPACAAALLLGLAGAAAAEPQVRWMLLGLLHEVRAPDTTHHPPAQWVVPDPVPQRALRVVPTLRACQRHGQSAAIVRQRLVEQRLRVVVLRTQVRCAQETLPANVG